MVRSVKASFRSASRAPVIDTGEPSTARVTSTAERTPGSVESLVTFASARVTFTTAGGVTERSTKEARPASTRTAAMEVRKTGAAGAAGSPLPGAGAGRRARTRLEVPSSQTYTFVRGSTRRTSRTETRGGVEAASIP